MREYLVKLSSLLITLPVLAIPLTALGLKPAFAQTVAAEQAVHILARARAADAKCQYLPVKTREELASYTAKAELSAAQKSSAAAVSAAMKAGTAEGQNRPCDAATKTDIDETVAAAREAVAAAEQVARERPKPAKPVAERRKTAKPVAERRKTAAPAAPVAKGHAALNRYSRLVRPYFIERRCRHLGRSAQTLYWKSIVRLHRRAAAESGAGAAREAMMRAEQQAAGVRCNETSLSAVTKGFAELTGR